MTMPRQKQTCAIMDRFGLSRLLTWRRALLPVALLLASSGQLAFGQAPSPVPGPSAPTKYYLPKSSFSLPVQIDDRTRPSLKEVQLYYKDSAEKPWMLKDRGSPAQTSFGVKLDQDGEYWFTVVTVDKAGRFMPPDLSHEPPGQIIVVDSTPPQVDAHVALPNPQGMCVHCDVKDANPENSKTKLEYQTADKQFRTADPIPGQADTFSVPQQANFTGVVRVTGVDRAGNSRLGKSTWATLPANLNPPPAIADAKMDTKILPDVPSNVTKASHEQAGEIPRNLSVPPPVLDHAAPGAADIY